jgi:flagellar hook-associated protein 1 FlgK
MGVDVHSIQRQRNIFLDQQFREYSSQAERFASLDLQFVQVEAIFNEPSDSGLSSLIDEFWDAWLELADAPESMVLRNNLRERTRSLTDGFRRVYRSLQDKRKDINKEIDSTIGNINKTLKDIADLNGKIMASYSDRAQPNDLLDQRDMLLDELSKLVRINVNSKEDGGLTVIVESHVLVDGANYSTLEVQASTDGDTSASTINVSTGNSLRITAGKLKGLLEMRDTYLPEYVNTLDQMARQLVNSVNAVHTAGYDLQGDTGQAFFDPTKISAATITVAPEILADAGKIAASADASVGDNGVAQSIADLRNALLFENGSTTLGDFYNNLIGSLGLKASEVTSNRENYELVIEQLVFQRDSVQGVSLDEEMANLIKNQEAFNAAAKMVTKVNEMIETILNMV